MLAFQCTLSGVGEDNCLCRGGGRTGVSERFGGRPRANSPSDVSGNRPNGVIPTPTIKVPRIVPSSRLTLSDMIVL